MYGTVSMGSTACASKVGRMAMSRALCLMNTLSLNVHQHIYTFFKKKIYIGSFCFQRYCGCALPLLCCVELGIVSMGIMNKQGG